MWYPVDYYPYRYPDGSGLPAGHIAYRPIIKTDLLLGAKRIDCLSIIDSGADHCVFPLKFALQIGLSPLGQTPFTTSGVGSDGVPMYYWNVKLDLGGVVQIDVLAGFTEDMDSKGIGLLGQYGFFDRYRINFDLPQRKFYIEIPYTPPAQSPTQI